MKDKIVLPRSKLVLTRYEDIFSLEGTGIRLGLETSDEGKQVFTSACGDGFWHYHETLEEAVERLDSFVFTLRRSLLAGTEETVAQAMWTHDEWNPHTLAEADASNVAKVRAGAAIYRDRARAVLAALCGEASS